MTPLLLLVFISPSVLASVDNDEIDICERGHVKIDGACFTFSPGELTWTEATDLCHAKNLHPARIDTKEKHDALNEYMSREFGLYEKFWTDVKRDGDEFIHTSNNSPVNVSFWNPGAPNTKSWKKCVYKYTFGWNNENCNREMATICESTECPSGCEDDTSDTEAVSTEVEVVHCNSGAKRIGNTCYYIETNRSVEREVANTECSQRSGRLASMNTDEKYSDVDEYLKTLPFVTWTVYWIAGQRVENYNMFSDDNQNVTGARWFDGEPNDMGGDEDCIQYMFWPYDDKYYWNDVNCGEQMYFICELTDCPVDCAVNDTRTDDCPPNCAVNDTRTDDCPPNCPVNDTRDDDCSPNCAVNDTRTDDCSPNCPVNDTIVDDCSPDCTADDSSGEETATDPLQTTAKDVTDTSNNNVEDSVRSYIGNGLESGGSSLQCCISVMASLFALAKACIRN